LTSAVLLGSSPLRCTRINIRQLGQRFGSFTKPFWAKNSCSPAVKTKVLLQSRQVSSLFWNDIALITLDGQPMDKVRCVKRAFLLRKRHNERISMLSRAVVVGKYRKGARKLLAEATQLDLLFSQRVPDLHQYEGDQYITFTSRTSVCV
jgi:hypothetical protein